MNRPWFSSAHSIRKATLPLSRGRSAAHWPHYETLFAAGDSYHSLAGVDPEKRLFLAVAAVGAVLVRYCAVDCIPIGVIAHDGTVRQVLLPVEGDTTMGALMEGARDALYVEGMPVHYRETKTLTAVFVSEQDEEQVVPDLRQDATVILRSKCSELACSFNPRLFDKDVVERFLAHIVFFINAALNNPWAPIATMEYLSRDEVTAIETATCPPPPPYPVDGTVQDLFRAAARRAPDSLALEFGTEMLSYRELESRSDRVAAGLIAAGVSRGVRVGLSVSPSADQIVALLGVLKMGATPVPIDYTFPRGRLAAIIATATLDLLITERSLLATHHGLAKLVCVDELVQTESQAINLPGEPEDVVYVLFTSGSTGVPKGVAIRQRTLVNLISWQDKQTPSAGRRTLHRASIAFDVGFQEVFSTLCWGGTLVIASEDERVDVTCLQRLIGHRQIERVFMPPVILAKLAELFSMESNELASLRNVIVSGEQLRITPAIVRMFRMCSAVLTNQYGPTETHVATSYDLEGSSLKWPLRPLIGRPISNARVHILDVNGLRCPFGVEGEITIGGLLPAVGYLCDPEDSRRHFVPDPFPGGGPSGVMYRTGDLGRLLADGTIEFVGRSDDQIKLRGYRVELGDIEANAMAIAGVKIAVATLKMHRDGNSYISLFLQMEPQTVFDARAIRNSLLSRLPRHMVPSHNAIVAVDRLPLNRNGKIDRRSLPEFEIPNDEENDGDTTSLAQRIVAIWKQHLHLHSINPNDDFFELGGDSLTAIQITSRTNETFGISAPVAILLRGGLLSDFTDKIIKLVAAKNDSPKVGSGSIFSLTEPFNLRLVTLGDGRVVETPYAAEAHHFFREVFQQRVYLQHGISIPDHGTVVDVGANIGLFSLQALDHAGSSTVIAIEPAPALVSAFKRNTAKFGERVQILDVGLGAHDGMSAFTYYPLLTGMSSFFPDHSRDRQLLAGLIAKERWIDPLVDQDLVHSADVYLDDRLASEIFVRPMRRLSSIISALRLGMIDLLKIDVPHGIDSVFDGIDASDWQKIHQIVVEFPAANGSGLTVAHRLMAQGFMTTTEGDVTQSGPDSIYIYGIRPS